MKCLLKTQDGELHFDGHGFHRLWRRPIIVPNDVPELPNAEAELRLECGGLAAGAAEQQA